MKRKQLVGLLLMLSISFYYQTGSCQDVVSKARATSRSALVTLQRVGLTDQSTRKFKQTIQSSINRLNAKLDKDRDGRIGDQVAVQSDLIVLVDKLYEYRSSPNEEKREELRGLAKSDSSITKFVRSVMDQQENPEYKFLPPVQE
jgi:hypothetical protein